MADPSARSDTSGRVVLLIDEDPQVARLVRLSLSGSGLGPGFEVLVGSRAQEGLRIAARQKPHVILMETRFSSGDGLMLASKLMQAPGTSGSAVAFFTDNDRPTHVLQAMQMGAVDYIRKPQEPRRLRARIDDVFARIGRHDPDGARGPGAHKLMQLCLRCERDRQSGAVHLRRAGEAALLSFRDGVLASAEYAGLEGFEAFVALAGHGDWDLRFEEGAVPLSALPTGQDPVGAGAVNAQLMQTQPEPGGPSSSFGSLAPEAGFGTETGVDADERTVLDPGAAAALRTREAPTTPPESAAPSEVATDPATVVERGVTTDIDGPSAARDFQGGAAARARQRRRSSPRIAAPARGASPARGAPARGAPPPRSAPPPRGAPPPSSSSPSGPASRLSESVDRLPSRSVPDRSRFTGPLPAATRRPRRPSEPGRADISQPDLTGPVLMPPAEEELIDADASLDALQAPKTNEVPQQMIEAQHDAEHEDVGFYDEDEPTMQMPATFKPVVDGEPQLVSLAAPGEKPMPGAAAQMPDAQATPPPTSVSREVLVSWIAAMGSPPLMLVVQNAEAGAALRDATEKLGLIVINVPSIGQAYAAARQRRPVAIISDSQLPDGAGRELLSALRSDFLVRESPFIMVSGEGLAQQIASSGADAALAPIMQGLIAALAPRAQLWQQLSSGAGEQTGWVEPLGIGNLLRILGACHFGGRLQLRVGEQRNAEVVLRRGEVCGVTVNAPQATVGPLAMLHLVGYEWQELALSREAPGGAQVPLGELTTLVETASRQNNVLMQRVYDEGLLIDDVAVDEHALDAYVRTLPPTSLDLLLRLKGGESPASLAQSGESNEGALKALLSDMRRKSVIRAQSLRVVRVEMETSWASFSPREKTEGDEPRPAQSGRSGGGRRFLVVLLTAIITVGMAAGGYLLYRHLTAGDVRGSGSGSGSGSALAPVMSPTKPVVSPTKPVVKSSGSGAASGSGTASASGAASGTGTGTGTASGSGTGSGSGK